jgi:hypothetical protein
MLPENYVCTSNDKKNLQKRINRTNEAMKIKYNYYDLVYENDTWCQVFSCWYHNMRAEEKALSAARSNICSKCNQNM